MNNRDVGHENDAKCVSVFFGDESRFELIMENEIHQISGWHNKAFEIDGEKDPVNFFDKDILSYCRTFIV